MPQEEGVWKAGRKAARLDSTRTLAWLLLPSATTHQVVQVVTSREMKGQRIETKLDLRQSSLGLVGSKSTDNPPAPASDPETQAQ